MTLSDARRAAVLSAAETVRDLVAAPEVGERWDDESVCDGMTVGGLTAHLAHQPRRVVEVLRGPSGRSDTPRYDALQHYRHAAWAAEAAEDPVNVSIRDDANNAAAVGHSQIVTALERDIAALPAAMDGAPQIVALPWQPWDLSAEDFLLTRLLEMVVHSDDLAASADLATPHFAAEAFEPVAELLARLSVERHGQAGLIRAFTRPERATSEITSW